MSFFRRLLGRKSHSSTVVVYDERPALFWSQSVQEPSENNDNYGKATPSSNKIERDEDSKRYWAAHTPKNHAELLDYATKYPRSKFCERCKLLLTDIQSHKWHDEAVARDIGRTHSHPEPIRSLQPPNSCDLCKMLWTVLQRSRIQRSRDFLDWKFALIVTQFGEAYDSDVDVLTNTYLPTRLCPRWRLGIEIVDGSGSKIRPQVNNAIQVSTRPAPFAFYKTPQRSTFRERFYMNGRDRPGQCDTELVKNWLRLCQRHHGVKCFSPPLSLQPDIRLIDTQDNCIVSSREVAGLASPNYIALSYVWGSNKQRCVLTENNHATLAKKGSLKTLQLCKTIADAVQLVQCLGIRYLWADALCIKQDVAADIEAHLAHMGFVYQNAVLTIVAAYGDDCDAGLPGIRPEWRYPTQDWVEFGDMTLVSSVQQQEGAIVTPESSKWARRAWTFQERLLSPRCVIFTQEQVWWDCQCATWCEESQHESKEVPGFALTPHRKKLTLDQKFSKLQRSDYFELIADYAQRELTFAADAMNAISGVLSTLTHLSGQEFFWGFLVAGFEHQLYWVGEARRRTPSWKEHCHYPTWSWAAWRGEISFRHYDTYIPSVCCFSMVVNKLGYEAVQQVSGAPVEGRQIVSIEEIRNLCLPRKTLRFHLFFWTYSAKFYLMPQGRLILPGLAPRYEHDDKGRMLGPKPDYGLLVPSPRGTRLCGKGEWECILLGERPAASAWDRVHVVIMLVTREFGIAQRRAIADMALEFWDLAEKSWELVALG